MPTDRGSLLLSVQHGARRSSIDEDDFVQTLLQQLAMAEDECRRCPSKLSAGWHTVRGSVFSHCLRCKPLQRWIGCPIFGRLRSCHCPCWKCPWTVLPSQKCLEQHMHVLVMPLVVFIVCFSWCCCCCFCVVCVRLAPLSVRPRWYTHLLTLSSMVTGVAAKPS